MAGSTKAAAAQPKTTEAPPRASMSLQEKFVKLREAVPTITQRQHSEGVKYKFAKIFDVYELLTPAMNQYGVNFDIVAEQATRHTENGDPMYFTSFQQNTRNGSRIVWVYEADLTIRWTNADKPDDILEVTLHALGTNDGGPDKAKGDMSDHASEGTPPAQNRPTAPQNGAGGRNTQPSGQTAQNGRTSAQRPLSDAQLSRMYRKGEDAGITQAQINDRIAKSYGQQDPHNMLDAEAKKQQGGNANV